MADGERSCARFSGVVSPSWSKPVATITRCSGPLLDTSSAACSIEPSSSRSKGCEETAGETFFSGLLENAWTALTASSSANAVTKHWPIPPLAPKTATDSLLPMDFISGAAFALVTSRRCLPTRWPFSARRVQTHGARNMGTWRDRCPASKTAFLNHMPGRLQGRQGRFRSRYLLSSLSLFLEEIRRAHNSAPGVHSGPYGRGDEGLCLIVSSAG